MKKLILFTLSFLICNLSFAQTIAEIQGTTDASPYDGQTVTTTGIVTATGPISYFIQDGTAIRSGVYVYDANFAPAVGDEITITGEVTEYFELTEIVNLTAFEVNSSGNPLPAPVMLTTAECNNEDYEGMLVQVNAATCSNADLGFGEWEVNDGSGPCAVDDIFLVYSPDEGIDYSVTGPLNYSFSAYKIEPRNADDIEIQIPLYFTLNPRESDIQQTNITITWETNIPSNSNLSYGLTTAFDLGTVTDATMSTSHEVTLDNLTAGTIYYVSPYSESGADATPPQTMVVCTRSTSSGEMKVYFNHHVDHSVATDELAVFTANIVDTVIAIIDEADHTLDITMYETESMAVVNAINAAYDRGVVVRVISDDEGSNDAFDNLNTNIAYLEGNPDGIMHDKFFIIDVEFPEKALVLTGSTNHTDANLGWDYNNVITIQDQSLAKAYTLEFNEMWGSTGPQFDLTESKFGPNKSDNTPHRFVINDIAVESYFSPSDKTAQKIVAAIDAAESQLAFAVLVFTENSLGTAVKDAYDRGVDTKGIIDYVEFNGSEFEFLMNNDVDVIDYQNDDGSQWPDGPTLHHKYAIIDYGAGVGSDNPLLITGSHNWSASANSIHDENTLMIYDHTLANIYYQEFSARFQGLSSFEDVVLKELDVNPNPFDKYLSFEFPENGDLVITDVNGRVLLSQKVGQGSFDLNTGDWVSGVYFIRFDGGEVLHFGRVVKE